MDGLLLVSKRLLCGLPQPGCTFSCSSASTKDVTTVLMGRLSPCITGYVPTIHSSAVAELYTPPVSENKKSLVAIGFRKTICIFALRNIRYDVSIQGQTCTVLFGSSTLKGLPFLFPFVRYFGVERMLFLFNFHCFVQTLDELIQAFELLHVCVILFLLPCHSCLR